MSSVSFGCFRAHIDFFSPVGAKDLKRLDLHPRGPTPEGAVAFKTLTFQQEEACESKSREHLV